MLFHEALIISHKNEADTTETLTSNSAGGV